jgi:hypothetical protein
MMHMKCEYLSSLYYEQFLNRILREIVSHNHFEETNVSSWVLYNTFFVLSFTTKQKRKSILKFGGNRMASLGVSVFSAHLVLSLLFLFFELDLKN